MRREMERVLAEVRKCVVGKDAQIAAILTALLAGGHVLLDDVPGVGKTTLAVALGRATGLRCRRVQGTPDVLPSDIVGFTLYDRESGRFLYRPGAISDAQLLLADEINRTSSRTQSALLEAMEERQVTVDGETHPLPKPFFVIATQNNVGTAGTQLLPYAQIDRFMVRLSLGYPDLEAQKTLLRDRQAADPLEDVQCVLSAEELLEAQQKVRGVTVKDVLLDYIARLVIASREREDVEVGVSPRGALHLTHMAMARAWLEGREHATAADVQAVFPLVSGHRVLLDRRMRARGARVEDVLQELLDAVPSPERG